MVFLASCVFIAIYVLGVVSFQHRVQDNAVTVVNEKCTGESCVLASHPKIKILVYSVWVGDEPRHVAKLNHKAYCDENGYEYRHFHYNSSYFAQHYTTKPGAWMSVFAAKELLETSNADYFFKMDLDCVFMRTDVRLESLIDPQQRYSFYITNSESQTRFMQSQSWILKKSEFSVAFIKEWLEYVEWGKCGDLAYEQGAMHLAIGMFYKNHLGANGTDYTCPHACTSLRSAYRHHHCVLDWLEGNGFGVAGSMNTHPHIFVFPYPNHTSYSSPEDGFFMQWGGRAALPAAYNPLTVHPLKEHIYATPKEVAAYVRQQ